jgi:3-oxoacyl-[acyl-carrier protein] reductase
VSGVALVTGAGRGIGRAVALELARSGHRCGLFARSEDQLEVVREECAQAGSEALAIPGDVAKPAAALRAVQACVERFGRLDVLVNNAGVFRTAGLLETDDELWQQVLRTNLDGAFYMSRAAAAAMIERGEGGTIVNIASIAGREGFAGSSAYCASKFGLVGLSEVLRLELTTHGIHVLCILPGQVDTAAWDSCGLDLDALGIDRAGMMQPADIAALIVAALASKTTVAEEIVLRPR